MDKESVQGARHEGMDRSRQPHRQRSCYVCEGEVIYAESKGNPQGPAGTATVPPALEAYELGKLCCPSEPANGRQKRRLDPTIKIRNRGGWYNREEQS